jgi:hypothetical protein
MVYHRNDNLGLLKSFVYIMGFVLMGGIIALVYIIYKHNSTILDNIPDVASSEASCEDLYANIELNSEAISIQNKNDKLIIVTKPEGGVQQILVFDYCKNKVMNNITVHAKNKTTR